MKRLLKKNWVRLGNESLFILSGRERTAKFLAMLVVLVGLAGTLSAVLFDIMLYGDGAYFVYALAADQPWLMKWDGIAARASTYLFTVVPAHVLKAMFNLSPLELTKLNAFTFYGLQVIQFIIACGLVWRRQPTLLMFPVASFVFLNSLGYGFPSEILLAPGFLWICLFLIARGKPFSLGYAVSFAALVFSHELALPAALVSCYVGAAYLRRSESKASRVYAYIAFHIVAVAAMFVVRAYGGGAGSDAQAIYVFDPRRLLANPSLYALILSIIVFVAASALMPRKRVKVALTVICGTALSIPCLLYFSDTRIDFGLGRYDSGRTIIGAGILGLAIAFAAMLDVSGGSNETQSAPKRENRISPVHALLVGLAAQIGTASAFIVEWNVGLTGHAYLSAPAEYSVPLELATVSDILTNRQAESFANRHFQWTYPYRSFVLANGLPPSKILYSAEHGSLEDHCVMFKRPLKATAALPNLTISEWTEFLCQQKDPVRPPTKSQRLMQWIWKTLGR